jgi:hypothetical protein
MLFEEFTNEVAGKIREYLPTSFSNAEIDLKIVTKNNDKRLTGLSIKSVDSNIAPTLYLESFFKEYEEGEELDNILQKIANARVAADAGTKFDADFMMNFESCKDRILPRLVSQKMNQSLLESRPHKVIEDLAVTYHITVSGMVDGMASAAITNDILKKWEVTLEEVDEAATKNLQEKQRSTIKSMSEVLSTMMGLEEPVLDTDLGLYVCSNESQMFGASCLLDKTFMSHVVEQYGKDGQVTVVPSSVHEVLIIGNSFDKKALSAIIQDVNQNTVDIEDQLSDHPYVYDINNGLISA